MLKSESFSDSESVESFETCAGTEEEEDVYKNTRDPGELFVPVKVQRLPIPKAPFIDELKLVQKLKSISSKEEFAPSRILIGPNPESSHNKQKEPSAKVPQVSPVLRQTSPHLTRFVLPKKHSKDMAASISTYKPTVVKLANAKKLAKTKPNKPLVTISTWAESRPSERLSEREAMTSQCVDSRMLPPPYQNYVSAQRVTNKIQNSKPAQISAIRADPILQAGGSILHVFKYLSLLRKHTDKDKRTVTTDDGPVRQQKMDNTTGGMYA